MLDVQVHIFCRCQKKKKSFKKQKKKKGRKNDIWVMVLFTTPYWEMGLFYGFLCMRTLKRDDWRWSHHNLLHPTPPLPPQYFVVAFCLFFVCCLFIFVFSVPEVCLWKNVGLLAHKPKARFHSQRKISKRVCKDTTMHQMCHERDDAHEPVLLMPVFTRMSLWPLQRLRTYVDCESALMCSAEVN